MTKFIDAIMESLGHSNPDSKVHGANMGPTWGLQDPGGPHEDPMNLVIWKDTPTFQRNSCDLSKII